ncbi:MAG TPA: pyridoxamine 5'-phosphate oxidase family protein [Sphingomicrobium sp.]
MSDRQETEAELEEKFWEAIEDSPFMMLGLQGVDNDFTRPMTAQVDDGRIYFFAARSEDLFKGLAQSSKAIATFAGKDHKLFASIHGRLAEHMDRALIDRLWNPIIASWYKEGKDDPDLVLLHFDANSADVWEAHAGATLKAAALKMLFNIDPGKEHQDEHRAQVELT